MLVEILVRHIFQQVFELSFDVAEMVDSVGKQHVTVLLDFSNVLLFQVHVLAKRLALDSETLVFFCGAFVKRFAGEVIFGVEVEHFGSGLDGPGLSFVGFDDDLGVEGISLTKTASFFTSY